MTWVFFLMWPTIFILTIWCCYFVKVLCCPTWMIQFFCLVRLFRFLEWNTRPWTLFFKGQRGVNTLFTNLHKNGKTPFCFGFVPFFFWFYLKKVFDTLLVRELLGGVLLILFFGCCLETIFNTNTRLNLSLPLFKSNTLFVKHSPQEHYEQQ